MCGVMTPTPVGLGMVLGPFFSWDGCLGETAGGGGGGGCWPLEEEPMGGAIGGGELVLELRSLRLKEVDINTLDCASFKVSL